MLCGVSPSLSLTTCPHPSREIVGSSFWVLSLKAFWCHRCAFEEKSIMNTKRVDRPSLEMKRHQIIPFAQSKMGVIFRLHLPRRKAKPWATFCCCKFEKGPSCDEERKPTLVPWGFLHKWAFIPRLTGALCLGRWFLRMVATNREGCNHPWKTFQTVLQANPARERAPTWLSTWFLSLFKALN